MQIKTNKTRDKLHAKVVKGLESNDFLNGGLAYADRKDEFETYVRGTSDLMKVADIEFTDTLRVNFDQEYLGRRVLQVGTEAATFTDTKKPDFGKSSLELKKFTGGYDISWETLVENIEKKDYQAHLTQIFMQKAATDLGDAAVNGDTTSGIPFYAQFDGWAKLANGGYIVDAAGNTISRNVFYNGFRELPKEVRKRKSQLRWFANTLLQTDWREVYGDRATLGGDSATRGSLISPDGIPIVTCDEFADDISVGYTSATYGKQIGTVQDSFVIPSTNTAITIDVTIDGAASGDKALTVTAGTYTAPKLAAHLNTLCVAASVAEVFTAYDGKLVIKTTKTGSTQSVKVTAVASSIYTIVGFTAQTDSGTDPSGTGTIDNGTFSILTIPNNFKFYMKENFRTYYEYDIDTDEWKFRTHFHANARIKDTSALSKVINIRLKNY